MGGGVEGLGGVLLLLAAVECLLFWCDTSVHSSYEIAIFGTECSVFGPISLGVLCRVYSMQRSVPTKEGNPGLLFNVLQSPLAGGKSQTPVCVHGVAEHNEDLRPNIANNIPMHLLQCCNAISV